MSHKQSEKKKRDRAKATSGRGALNQRARDAAKEAGLNQDQMQRFHRALSNDPSSQHLSYRQLVEMAKRFRR